MRFTHSGTELAGEMCNMTRTLDPDSGRGTTSGYPFFNDQDSAFLHELDVPGYNYAGQDVYAKDHQRLPDRTMVGTESVAQDSLRMYGYVTQMPWVVGDFIWTAIDYYGDEYFPSTTGDVDYLSGKIPFPWHISNSGDLDVIGYPKPQSTYRTVLWGVKDMGMLVHRPSAKGTISAPGLPEKLSLWGWPDELESWTWPGFEGHQVQVRVFARGCEQARLLLNGAHLADAPVQSNLTSVFVVPYAPGTLTAQCVNGSSVLPHAPSVSLQTASVPTSVKLTADRETIAHDARDLMYITAALVDANGILVINTSRNVTFTIASGPGEIIAVGSADPQDPTSLRAKSKRFFRGRAIVIVRPLPAVAAGTVVISASVDGLALATVAVKTVPGAFADDTHRQLPPL